MLKSGRFPDSDEILMVNDSAELYVGKSFSVKMEHGAL